MNYITQSKKNEEKVDKNLSLYIKALTAITLLKKYQTTELYDEKVWLNQKQIVDLFESSKSNISEHIKHIFQENELEEELASRTFPVKAKKVLKFR